MPNEFEATKPGKIIEAGERKVEREDEEDRRGSIEDLLKELRSMGDDIVNDGKKEVTRAMKESRAPRSEIDNLNSEVTIVHRKVDMTVKDLERHLNEEEVTEDVVGIPRKLEIMEKDMNQRGQGGDVIAREAYTDIYELLDRRAEGKDLNPQDEISEAEREDIDLERDSIKEAMSYLVQEGVNPNDFIASLSQHIYQERNKAEMELDPTDYQKSESVKRELDVLKEILEDGEVILPLGKEEAYKGIIETEKGSEVDVDILDENNDLIRSERGKIKDILEEYADKKRRGEKLRFDLTESTDAAMRSKISEIEDMLNRKPAEGGERENIMKKISNQTEMLKVLSGVQKEYFRTKKVWEEQLNRAKDVFNLNDDQYKNFIQSAESSKTDFIRSKIKQTFEESRKEDLEESIYEEFKMILAKAS